MQCIYRQRHSNLESYVSDITTKLQQAIYQPSNHNLSIHPLQYCQQCAQAARSNVSRLAHPVVTRLRATKRLWQAMGLLALCLPSKSLTGFAPLDGFEKVTLSNTLTVAIEADALFQDGTHMHSLAYDSAKRYADHLNVELVVKSYQNTADAVAAVHNGSADLIIGAPVHDDTIKLTSSSVGCDSIDFSKYGLSELVISGNTHNQTLMTHAQDYLCSTTAHTETMAKFYNANTLNGYSVNHFERTMKNRLPTYARTFQAQAKKYDHDWQLLAAISYQESHLDPNATSPTGVQGIMMLTQDTATAMGVSDRTNPTQSIQGGAKYLDQLKNSFDYIPEAERLWFVLAAYNMGPNAVKNIQNKLTAAGKDPNLWSNFYAHLSDNAKKNSRYVQCMHYVTNIRSYLELLKA